MYYLAGTGINVFHVFIPHLLLTALIGIVHLLYTVELSFEPRSTRVLRNVSTPPPTLRVPIA